MRLIAVPTDAHPNVVFGAKTLPDPGPWAAEFLDLRDDLFQPSWDRIGPLQLAQSVVVSKTERRHPPLALKLAKLERLERQGPDFRNEFLFDGRRNRACSVAQPFWLRRRALKQG
jgi:hypothetical protein